MKKIKMVCRLLAGIILAFMVVSAVVAITGCDDSSMFHEFGE